MICIKLINAMCNVRYDSEFGHIYLFHITCYLFPVKNLHLENGQYTSHLRFSIRFIVDVSCSTLIYSLHLFYPQTIRLFIGTERFAKKIIEDIHNQKINKFR